MTSHKVGRFVCAGSVALLSACGRLAPERQLVRNAAQAIGGQVAIEAVAVLTVDGSGTQYSLGQDLRPGLANQTFTVRAYRREFDLVSPAARTTQTRTPNFPYFQGPQAQTQVQGVDDEVAYNAVVDGAATRVSNAVAADRRAERFHHPITLLRAALAPGAALSAVRAQGAARAVDVTTDAGPITLVVDASGRPTRIESRASHANLGDVVMTTTFSDYADAGGLQLPTRLTTRVDDFITGEYTVTNGVAATGSVEAPAEANTAAEPAAPAVRITTEQLAPGVWFLAGQSHHSVVVAFTDRLVLIEAPQSEARALAVIATARDLRPGTPLTHVVLSHHHFDHSTGLRAAIAEGLTVITHEGNRAFVDEMAVRPFTRNPDALAKRPKAVTVETVADTLTLTDGTRSLVLYHVAGNPHSDTMLMAYLPAERLLVEVDAFSPGGTYQPYAANLLDHVERLKLRVDRIVPLHGAVVPFKDLVLAARPPV